MSWETDEETEAVRTVDETLEKADTELQAELRRKFRPVPPIVPKKHKPK